MFFATRVVVYSAGLMHLVVSLSRPLALHTLEACETDSAQTLDATSTEKFVLDCDSAIAVVYTITFLLVAGLGLNLAWFAKIVRIARGTSRPERSYKSE